MNLEEILNVIKPHYPNAIIDDLVNCITYKREETEDGETKESVDYRISLKNDKILLTEDISEYYWDNYEKRYKFDMYDDSNHHTYTTAILENNLFELKRVLNIEITWEDLVEYVKTVQCCIGYDDNHIMFTPVCFTPNHDVTIFYAKTREEYTYKNRSYLQMYYIIKNLFDEKENE